MPNLRSKSAVNRTWCFLVLLQVKCQTGSQQSHIEVPKLKLRADTHLKMLTVLLRKVMPASPHAFLEGFDCGDYMALRSKALANKVNLLVQKDRKSDSSSSANSSVLMPGEVNDELHRLQETHYKLVLWNSVRDSLARVLDSPAYAIPARSMQSALAIPTDKIKAKTRKRRFGLPFSNRASRSPEVVVRCNEISLELLV